MNSIISYAKEETRSIKEFPFNDEKIKEYYKQFEEETKKKGDYENKD